MDKKTVAIIGGSQKSSFEQTGKKFGLNVIFNDAKGFRSKAGMRELKQSVKKADYIIVLLEACCHRSMEEVKKLAKSLDKPIAYQPKGFGITGVIELAVKLAS